MAQRSSRCTATVGTIHWNNHWLAVAFIDRGTIPKLSGLFSSPRYELATDGFAVTALRSDGHTVSWAQDRSGQCGLPFGGSDAPSATSRRINLGPGCLEMMRAKSTWLLLGILGCGDELVHKSSLRESRPERAS